MKTVVLEVMSAEDATADFLRAWKSGQGDGAEHIGFATPELLWKVLTAKRWELLKAMAGAGPLGVRELARRAGRDVKGVHTDAMKLAQAGVIERTSDGKLLFPYERVDVRFSLNAAA
ncbi:DNA-binding protein [Oleomonas cavernae]|uniref:DNA-binding protein n=1 Tax=Oleomonas cavernae TaxID=2320859 RepID=A0A418WAH1_9PROT|nr:DNA-binding protein [Oleomonas cavernae]RJF87012.1 DNA-binding protein [Oleomonas cavernae]